MGRLFIQIFCTIQMTFEESKGQRILNLPELICIPGTVRFRTPCIADVGVLGCTRDERLGLGEKWKEKQNKRKIDHFKEKRAASDKKT